MKYIIRKRPRRATIIEGFPGYGLVGSIVTNFLIDTLNMEPIGSLCTEKIPAVASIHKKDLRSPLGLYYSKDLNIIVSNVLVSSREIEWDYARAIIDLSKELNIKRIISIEGIHSPTPKGKVYAFTNNSDEKERLQKKGFKFIDEGMIIGPTAALMLLTESTPIIGLFAETRSGIPDSRAAAEAIKAIDKYLGLKIDYEPLIKQAEEFEEALKKVIEQTRKAQEEQERKRLDYFG